VDRTAIAWEFPARIEIPIIISSSTSAARRRCWGPNSITFFSQTKYTCTPNMFSLPLDKTYKIQNAGDGLYLAVDETTTGSRIVLKPDSSDLNIRVWTDSIGFFPISCDLLLVDFQLPMPGS
jgi:hypothetical protein